MDQSEIPEAIKEFWPKLRTYMEKQLLLELKAMQAGGDGYEQVGIASVSVTRLLDRVSKDFTDSTNVKQPGKGVPRLRT